MAPQHIEPSQSPCYHRALALHGGHAYTTSLNALVIDLLPLSEAPPLPVALVGCMTSFCSVTATGPAGVVDSRRACQLNDQQVRVHTYDTYCRSILETAAQEVLAATLWKGRGQ